MDSNSYLNEPEAFYRNEIALNDLETKGRPGDETVQLRHRDIESSDDEDERERFRQLAASQMSTQSVLDMLPSRRMETGPSMRRRSMRRRNGHGRKISGRGGEEVVEWDEVDGFDEDEAVDPRRKSMRRQASLRKSSVRMKTKLSTMRTIKERERRTLYKRSCWKSFKYAVSVNWKHFKDKLKEAKYIFNLWWSHLKQVESYFGTGIVSYFVFLRWVFLVNVLLASLWFFFVFIPQVAITDANTNTTAASSLGRADVAQCMENVTLIDLNASCPNCSTSLLVDFLIQQAKNETEQPIVWYDYILSFFTGTGWMENTYLFIGHYSNQALVINSNEAYNLPLAYIMIGGLFFLLSLIFLVHRMASTYRRNFVEGISTGKKNPFFNLVFTAWDYAITSLETAKLRHLSVKRELEEAINTERAAKMQYSLKEISQIWGIRLVVNLVVLFLLGAAGVAIYYAAKLSIDESVAQVGQQSIDFASFIRQLAASLTISTFNVVYPFIFELLVPYERYKSLATEFGVTIVRSVALRVAGLVVLMATLLRQVQCSQSISSCGIVISAISRSGSADAQNDAERVEAFVEKSASCKLCWETYVGQEVYRLLLVDFLVDVLATLLHESLRHLAVHYIRFVRNKVGKAEFVISKNVLNLVYSQALIWLGAFFAPLLPVVGTLMFFIVFYVKKCSLVWNCRPSRRAYRVTKTSTFFLFLLLMTLFACLIPIGYSMVENKPSAVCGPFSDLTRIYDVVTNEIAKAPNWLQGVLDYIGSAAFVLPFIIVLCLLVYYFIFLSHSYKKSIKILEHQLQMEGRDKQFLIKTVSQQSIACGGGRTGNILGPPAVANRLSQARLSGSEGMRHVTAPKPITVRPMPEFE
eukprot:m.182734 g.182734  ORF g.182734 m.182734 type:complete len:866 (+) comp39295_c0_seq49:160-2757(+)